MPQEFMWYNQVAGYNRILELTDKEQCKCVYTRERGQQGVFTKCLALFCGLHKHFANGEIRTQLQIFRRLSPCQALLQRSPYCPPSLTGVLETHLVCGGRPRMLELV